MIEISDFGKFENENIKLFTITNSNNLVAKFTNFGAILISFHHSSSREVNAC